jgi:hypothetical protein
MNIKNDDVARVSKKLSNGSRNWDGTLSSERNASMDAVRIAEQNERWEKTRSNDDDHQKELERRKRDMLAARHANNISGRNRR